MHALILDDETWFDADEAIEWAIERQNLEVTEFQSMWRIHNAGFALSEFASEKSNRNVSRISDRQAVLWLLRNGFDFKSFPRDMQRIAASIKL